VKCPICGEAIPDGRGVVFGGTSNLNFGGWANFQYHFYAGNELTGIPGSELFDGWGCVTGTICKACFKGER